MGSGLAWDETGVGGHRRPAGDAGTSGPVSAPGQPGGPAYRLIDRVLSGFEPYRRFRAGTMAREDYSDWVEAEAAALGAAGLDEDQRSLSTRFPLDERSAVATMLAELRDRGAVARTSYPEAQLADLAAAVEDTFDHAGHRTYIFPEEARLLFAVAHLVAPQRTVFLGSYYGYWAVWALPGILAAGGRATLVDVDPDVLALAERNFRALGFDHGVEFQLVDATRPPPPHERDVDLCVLDAEGPGEGAAAKAIYHPIMSAWTPTLRPGALLVAHNMLLRNLTGNRYFARKVADNEHVYARFGAHLARHYPTRVVFDTTEGVGVYQKGRPGGGGDQPCAV